MQTGVFRMAIAKSVELPERGANSFTFGNKNRNITADVLSKNEKSERHAGREAKNKRSPRRAGTTFFIF